MSAGALVDANSVDAPFLFDDHAAIVDNLSIRKLWPPWSPAGALSPPSQSPAAGRPLVNLSLAINYAVGGLQPWVYRLWNQPAAAAAEFQRLDHRGIVLVDPAVPNIPLHLGCLFAEGR